MDRSNVIYLISNNPQQSELGVWVDNITSRKVYAEVSSVGQNEWYEGGRNGLNPQYRFRMFAPDYHGESLLMYNGVAYSIYRTYIDRNEVIDLYTEYKKGI